MLAPLLEIARQDGIPVFLVCGAVRDLMLRRPVRDVDVAVEGDAIALASRVARATGGTMTSHGRFGTAKISLPGGATLDLARTRRESYERPAALPEVKAASIEEDLARRDFTINAMAIALAPSRRRLLDPFGGSEDLASGIVRMLHPRSAFDDPTRAFRAVRFANRFGFAIEPRTRRWIREALSAGAFGALSGDRLRRELRLIFEEPRSAAAVAEMGRLGISRALSPALGSGRAVLDRLRAAERIATANQARTSWRLFLLTWAADLDAASAERLAVRLNLDRRSRRLLARWPARLARLQTAAAPADASADEIAAAAACEPDSARRRRLERLISGPPGGLSIAGSDLVRAGVPAGPAIGRALARTRNARLAGEIPPDRELEYALAIAREGTP